jgi:putative FmdB family regulatory protein
MPTYEYECEKCGHRFEVFQRMSDPKLEDCPKDSCGGHVRRLIGRGAGIIFKGSGFYETDYKKNGSGKTAKAKAKEKSEGAGAKSESKSGGDSGSSGSSCCKGSSCGCGH